MKKAEKTFFVENLTEELKSAKGIVLINYTGLSVKTQQSLQKRLKEVKAKMLIVKNTLLKRACEAAKINNQILTSDILTGQTALVIAEADPIAPLQVLGNFIKEFELPQIKVGLIEDSFKDKQSLVTISNLPGHDVLLGQLLGVLMAPSYGLIGTLNLNLQKLVHILKTKTKGGE
jgi:large subunit ribosomal protein L10